MSRLILVRHGESEGNRDRRFTPHPDVPITDAGRAQARAAAALIRECFVPGRLVSSPFLRARQTADILGEALGLDVTLEEDVRERHMGEFAGQPYGAPRPGFDPDAWWQWRPPGGETLSEVAARAGAVLDRIAATATRDVIIVTHGGVMLALTRHVTGAWGAGRVTRNAGIIVVRHADGRYLGLEALEGTNPA